MVPGMLWISPSLILAINSFGFFPFSHCSRASLRHRFIGLSLLSFFNNQIHRGFLRWSNSGKGDEEKERPSVDVSWYNSFGYHLGRSLQGNPSFFWTYFTAMAIDNRTTAKPLRCTCQYEPNRFVISRINALPPQVCSGDQLAKKVRKKEEEKRNKRGLRLPPTLLLQRTHRRMNACGKPQEIAFLFVSLLLFFFFSSFFPPLLCLVSPPHPLRPTFFNTRENQPNEELHRAMFHPLLVHLA